LTADKQEVPTSGAVGGEAAKEAALIATFYGPRADQRINRLHDKLSLSLSNKPLKAFLERFEPPGGAAHDAIAVQLALNVPGEAAKGWKDARQTLQSILSDATALEGTWGHTLIYQAELREGVDPDSALEELLPAIRRLHSSNDLGPLAAVKVSGGRLWLLCIPDRGEGLEAATVYAALSPPEEAEALQAMFYGPVAMLLEPDLIAHKGYYLMRQYRGEELQNMFEESAKKLRQTTSELLGGLSSNTLRTDKLDELAGKYQRLFPVVAQLSELHTALVKQKHNYENSSKTRPEGGEIVEFHGEHLETATLELNLEIVELQHDLEAADKAVSMAQVKVDEAQKGRQVRIEAGLAAAGVALALPHLLEPETISALLGLWPLEIHVPHTHNRLLTDAGHLMVLVAQVAIIGPIAYLTYRLVSEGLLHKLQGLHKRVLR
jgi:hypothetical protein